MKRVGIVVLNYINYRETIQCVKSIFLQKGIEFVVAIVDNGSNNESLDILTSEFSSIENVHIIASKTNLGYARGNNLGISYLRKQGMDFIVICNSDITFSSERILYMMREQNDDSIGVMIPIIRNLDGTIEMRAQYKTKFFPLRVLKELKKMQNIIPQKQSGHYKLKNNMEILTPGIQRDYYVITGSVFALTPSFFANYDGLFPETFLYVEELATMLLVYKAKLKCAIIKTDDVIHKGAASTELNLKAGSPQKRKMIAESARKVEKLVYMPSFLIKRIYRN